MRLTQTQAKLPPAPFLRGVTARQCDTASQVRQVLHYPGNQIMQHILRAKVVQAKLTVSQPGDEYEQEADRVATTVMRMGVADSSVPAISGVRDSGVQRKCQGCEEEEVDQTLQAKEMPGHQVETSSRLHAQLRGLSGGGQPLSPVERQFFEPRFGQDFGGVRIHKDARAAESARSINAQAYTFGHNIVFSANQYAPEASTGKRLLAHELTHVVQQTRSATTIPGGYSAAKPSGKSEHKVADRVRLNSMPFIARQQPAATRPTTLEPIDIVGDPHLYSRAQRRNQYYAAHPPIPGWPYDDRLRQLWRARAYDDFASAVQEYQVTVMGQTWEQADGILGPQTATSLQTRPLTPTAPQPQVAARDPVAAIRQDPNYVERRVIGVGIYGWGGPFRLSLEVNSQQIPTRSILLPRSLFSLGADPFTGNAEMALVGTIYASETQAREAVRTSSFNLSGFVTYAFYRDENNIIYPTIMSDTTTPYLLRALRLAIMQERANARAASELLINAYLTAAGLRMPIRAGSPSAAPAAVAGVEEIAALRQSAQGFVNQIRQAGGRVRINLGGTGEVAEAINVNPLRDQQVLGVPRLVRATAERIGELFSSGSVDEVLSNNIVRGQVDWAASLRGAFQILRSGGRVSISPYTGDIVAHMAEIEAALRAAGFQNITRVHEVIITAIRP